MKDVGLSLLYKSKQDVKHMFSTYLALFHVKYQKGNKGLSCRYGSVCISHSVFSYNDLSRSYMVQHGFEARKLQAHHHLL